MSEKQKSNKKLIKLVISLSIMLVLIAAALFAINGYNNTNTEKGSAKLQIEKKNSPKKIKDASKIISQATATFDALDININTFIDWYLIYASNDPVKLEQAIKNACDNFINTQSSLAKTDANKTKCANTLTIIFNDIKKYKVSSEETTTSTEYVSVKTYTQLAEIIINDLRAAESAGNDTILFFNAQEMRMIMDEIEAIQKASDDEKKAAIIKAAKDISKLAANKADITALNSYCDTNFTDEQLEICKLAISLIEIYKGSESLNGQVSSVVIPKICETYAPDYSDCAVILNIIAKNIQEYYVAYSKNTSLVEPFVVSVITDLMNSGYLKITLEDIQKITNSVNAIQLAIANGDIKTAVTLSQELAKEISTIVVTEENIQKALIFCNQAENEKTENICILLAKSAALYTDSELVNGDIIEEVCENTFTTEENIGKCMIGLEIIVKEIEDWYKGGYSVVDMEQYLVSIIDELYKAGAITDEENYQQIVTIIESANAFHKAIIEKDKEAMKKSAETLSVEIAKLIKNNVTNEDLEKVCEKSTKSELCKTFIETTIILNEYGIKTKEDVKPTLIALSCQKAFPEDTDKQQSCVNAMTAISDLAKYYYETFDINEYQANKDENNNGINDYIETMTKQFLNDVVNILTANIQSQDLQNFVKALKNYNESEKTQEDKENLKTSSKELGKSLITNEKAVETAKKVCEEKITDETLQESCKTAVLALEIYQNSQNANKSDEDKQEDMSELISRICSKSDDPTTCTKSLNAINNTAKKYYPEYKSTEESLENYLTDTKKQEIVATLAKELFIAEVITIGDLIAILEASQN